MLRVTDTDTDRPGHFRLLIEDPVQPCELTVAPQRVPRHVEVLHRAPVRRRLVQRRQRVLAQVEHSQERQEVHGARRHRRQPRTLGQVDRSQLKVVLEGAVVDLEVDSVVAPVDDERLELGERREEVQVLQVVESDVQLAQGGGEGAERGRGEAGEAVGAQVEVAEGAREWGQ